MSSPSPSPTTAASPANTSALTSASASPNTTPSSASTPSPASTPSKPKLNVAAKPWTPGSAAIPVPVPVPVPVTHATLPIPIPVSSQPIIAPIHVNPNHHHTTSITTAPLSAVLSSSSPTTTGTGTATSVPASTTSTSTNTSSSASASASKPKLRASASAFVPSFAKPTTPPSTTSSHASVAVQPNGVAHASTTATATPTPTSAATATTPATTPAAAPTSTSAPTTPATTASTPATATATTSSSSTTTTSTPATSTATSEDESRRKDSTASASTSTATATLSASKKSPALNPLIPKVDLPVVRARKPAAQRVRQAKVNDDDGDRDVTRDRSGSHVNADGDEEPIETTEKKEIISGFVPPSEGDHRKYDREFLMTFKDICLDPPPGLPDQIEGVLRAASERRGSSAGMGADWRGATRAPTKLDGSLGPQNRYGMLRPGAGGDSSRFPSSSSSSSSFRSVETRRQPSSGSSIRPSSGARGSTTDTRRTQSSSQAPLVTGPIEPLAKSENRYQVMKDIPQDVKLLRSLNSILNKLTPEKFDLLVEKVMELDITTAALLRDCVTAVFEKALAEPNFSPTYAEFCVRLSERLPAFNADENDTKKSTNFKRLILNRCQQEFEDEADHTETMSKLPTEEEKEFFRIKMKRRTLGTIRFIGELFARSMLQAAIMKQCLVKLLGDVNAPVEEDIEALCKLLDTVGHLLDKDKHKEFLDLLYTNMKTLSTSKLLSSRIRFMLQDSIELRAKGWVARRKAEQAKKISDIRTEVKPTITVSEVTKIAPLRPANRFDQISSGSSLRPGASRFDRYSFKKEPASSPKRNKNNSTGTDDWATVGSAKKWTGGRTPQGPLSPEKNSHQRQSSQAKSKEVEPVKPRGNAFDMLGDEDDHDQNDADEHEHEHDDENNADEKSSTVTTSTSTAVLSEDELKSKVQSLLKEFFSVYDMNEVTTCVTELGSVNIHHGVVLEGLLLMIEGKDKDRELFSKLLIHLYKEQIITREHITKAFDEMITLTEDISIDIPKTLEHLATVLSALIAADVVPLNYLNDAPLDTLNPGEGARLAILILQSLRKSRGDEDVVSTFKDAHLNFVSWLKDIQTVDAAKKLLNDKKLDVLVDHVSA